MHRCPVTIYYVSGNHSGVALLDIIFLHDLQIKTVIGVNDWERKTKQTVVIDLELGANIAPAAASDSIDDTLSYKVVAKRLTEYVGNCEFELVETLAERIAELVLSEFDVPWLRLKVNKRGAVRGVRDVGVIIERSRGD